MKVAKKKKKRVFKIKNIIILFSVFCMIVGLFYYAITMPIKNIYIKGNNILSDDEIIKLASLEEYPSFLFSLKSKIKNNLEQNIYIKEAQITKKFRNIIEIMIKEYQPIVITKEGNILLSSGQIVENNHDLTDAPLMVNSIDNKKIEKNFALKFGNIDMNILRQISQIEYSPVTVDEDRFLLYMNDGNLVYITLTKINKLNKYNQIKDKLDGKKGIIYLDSGDYVELKKEVE